VQIKKRLSESDDEYKQPSPSKDPTVSKGKRGRPPKNAYQVDHNREAAPAGESKPNRRARRARPQGVIKDEGDSSQEVKPKGVAAKKPI
jgi:hypothetical protein